MKLYKLTVSFETVVAAEDATTAAEIARKCMLEIVRDNDRESAEVKHVSRVIEGAELPSGWNTECFPYGIESYRKIKEILSET